MNQIDYDFQETPKSWRRLKIHVAGCTDTWGEGGITKKADWVWVSSRPLTQQNVLERCNRAARHRWGIEENILQEKHHGYQYEHAFSLNWSAMKKWHVMMHLEHLLNTLTLHTDALIKKVHELGIRGTLNFSGKVGGTLGSLGIDYSRPAQNVRSPECCSNAWHSPTTEGQPSCTLKRRADFNRISWALPHSGTRKSFSRKLPLHAATHRSPILGPPLPRRTPEPIRSCVSTVNVLVAVHRRRPL
ncbi:hypothetical protein [Alicyclobacillus acidiphilus]|uniref:hypothetical protein n=1 Tax=Alicyclobacillus acidiphilus TaxID=182455 RepID=UPI0012EE8C6B|nr:hypothetical protein [Alicyclobacillus acidiphilus]